MESILPTERRLERAGKGYGTHEREEQTCSHDCFELVIRRRCRRRLIFVKFCGLDKLEEMVSRNSADAGNEKRI